MKTTASYFRIHLKNNLLPLLIITFLSLLYCLLSGLYNQPYRVYSDFNAYTQYYHSTLQLPLHVMILLCFFAPVAQFGTFQKRKNLDFYYSVPISRKALCGIHYLTGLITVLLPFSFCYFENLILLLSRPAGSFDFAPMLPHFLLCLLFGTVIYSILAFAFNQANTVYDGCVFMLLYVIGLEYILQTLAKYKLLFHLFDTSYFSVLLSPFTVTGYYERLIEQTDITYVQETETVMVVFWSVLGVLALIGLLLGFGKRGAERKEGLSDTWFGYKLLIPLLAVCAFILYHNTFRNKYITWFWIELFTVIGYTLYRRGFHYKKSDVAVMLSLLLFLIVYLI